MTSPTVDAAVRRLLDEGRVRATGIDAQHARLWEALSRAAEGGKRFRPALLMEIHQALGGDRHQAAAEVGAAIELLHTAFIVHDDVIDEDDRRRGRLNVSGTFSTQALSCGASSDDATALGRTAGILAGDLALAAAIRAVATCGVPAQMTHRLLDLFDAALHTTAAGELADVRLSMSLGAGTLAESLTMEAQKTSDYSFSLPLQAGAVLAGAEETTVEQLGRAGLVFGVAFQLVDDLLGVFGDPTSTGKSASCDLRTNKQTPLLVHARSTPQWHQIRAYVGRHLTDDELGEAQRLLTSSGSRLFVEDLARRQVAEAQELLARIGIPHDVLDALTVASGMLLRRAEVAA